MKLHAVKNRQAYKVTLIMKAYTSLKNYLCFLIHRRVSELIFKSPAVKNSQAYWVTLIMEGMSILVRLLKSWNSKLVHF